MNSNESTYLNDLLCHIKVLRDNSVYRLGDVIFCKGFRWEQDRATILNTPEKYSETIAYKYLAANKCSKNLNLGLLHSLVNGKIRDDRLKLPNKDELVIHIRAGDLVALGDTSNRRTDEYIRLIQKARRRHAVTRVTIVTLLHYGNYVERGEWLHTDESETKNKENLKFFLEQVHKRVPGIQLGILSNTDIDNDLCYLSKAQHLILDTGGFSFLAGLLNSPALLEPKRRWGKVAARTILYIFPNRQTMPGPLRRLIGF